jgi:putative transposase
MRLLDEQYTRTPFYGSRKMTEWLRLKGFLVNRKRVSRLMELMASGLRVAVRFANMRIEAVYPKPKLSQPGEGHKIYPSLLNGLEVRRVNQVWSTDITYIRKDGARLCLLVVWWTREFRLGNKLIFQSIFRTRASNCISCCKHLRESPGITLSWRICGT